MPSVSEGLEQGREGSSDSPGEDSFTTALREQVGKGPREVAAADVPQSREPWNSSTDDIDRAVLADDFDPNQTDVQRGLDAGAPRKPGETIDFKDLEVEIAPGETVTAEDIWQSLGAAVEENEQFRAELGDIYSDDALDAFDAAVSEGFGDHKELVEAAADLLDSVVDGHVAPEDAREAISEAVAELIGFVDDPDEFLDEEDEYLQRARFDEALQLISELAFRTVDARQAESDHRLAEELLPEVVEQRVKEWDSIQRRFARDQGITSDAELQQRVSEAEAWLRAAGTDLEAMMYSLDGWSAERFEQLLRDADDTLRAADTLDRTHRLHQQILSQDTSIESGLTMPSPWGPVPAYQPQLANPWSTTEQLERESLRRMNQPRRTADDLRSSLMAVESTDVAAGLKAGEGAQ